MADDSSIASRLRSSSQQRNNSLQRAASTSSGLLTGTGGEDEASSTGLRRISRRRSSSSSQQQQQAPPPPPPPPRRSPQQRQRLSSREQQQTSTAPLSPSAGSQQLPPVQEVVLEDLLGDGNDQQQEAASVQTHQHPQASPVATDLGGHTVGIQVETPPQGWRLTLRTEPTRKNPRRELVRIWVAPGMTESQLSQCIEQVNGLDVVLGREWNVAGLFRESDGLFCSLSHVMQHVGPESPHEVWTLAIPHFHMPQPDPIWTDAILLILGVMLIATLWLLAPFIWSRARRWTDTLFELVVNMPIREAYRYGPSFVGWEGMRLAKICARITYHADQEFWQRNMVECERIYAMKEEAHLRTVRPVLYVVFTVLLFWTIRTLMHEWARARVVVPKIDRDMLETYEGFNMIVRQFSRAMNPQNRTFQHEQSLYYPHHQQQQRRRRPVRNWLNRYAEKYMGSSNNDDGDDDNKSD